jgi:hypothetical protein
VLFVLVIAFLSVCFHPLSNYFGTLWLAGLEFVGIPESSDFFRRPMLPLMSHVTGLWVHFSAVHPEHPIKMPPETAREILY